MYGDGLSRLIHRRLFNKSTEKSILSIGDIYGNAIVTQ